jgi:hypothetical protein
MDGARQPRSRRNDGRIGQNDCRPGGAHSVADREIRKREQQIAQQQQIEQLNEKLNLLTRISDA